VVFMRRRRHLHEKRCKNIGLQVTNGEHVGLQVPNGREAPQDEKGPAAQQDEKGAAAQKDESADEMAAPEPKPTSATKAPEARTLVLAVQEGFELQNTPVVSSILQMFSPKPEGFQHVFSSFRAATSRADDGDLNA
jgi:hypothetical protein